MKDQTRLKPQLILELRGQDHYYKAHQFGTEPLSQMLGSNCEIKFIPNVLTNSSQGYSQLETKTVWTTKEFQENIHTIHLVTNEAPLEENYQSNKK